MKRYIVRRLGYSLLSLFLLSLTIFLFVRVTGDPATLLVEPGASQADIDAIRQQFGLDQPLWVQYWQFMASLAQGDLGQSFYYRTPVLELYLSRLPNSLLLALAAMAFSLLIGIPSGILAAVRVGRFWDSAGKVFALLGLSLPSFWVGLVLILFFSVYLGWLPSSGSGTRAAPAHAGLRARLVLRRRAHAAHALLHARGAGLGVHQARPPQGPAGVAGHRQARVQERADPGADAGRHQPRHHDQRRRGGGDGVRLARHRPAALRGHHLPRLPGRPGRRAHGRRHDRGGEPAGRHPLRRDRSAHPTGEADGHGYADTEAVPPLPSRLAVIRGWRASR